MNIPAKVVIAKMEEELAKLKQAVEDAPGSGSYREQAVAIKTYCDLLLSSTEAGTSANSVVPKVRHASVADVKAPASKQKERYPVYDDDDEYGGDSLLDF